VQDDAMEDDTIEDDPMYEGTLREENDRMQDEQLSAYEKRQLKLNAKISELEKEAVAEKPWELRVRSTLHLISPHL
jgi:U3 small nucleolar ribonucleoprotein component